MSDANETTVEPNIDNATTTTVVDDVGNVDVVVNCTEFNYGNSTCEVYNEDGDYNSLLVLAGIIFGITFLVSCVLSTRWFYRKRLKSKLTAVPTEDKDAELVIRQQQESAGPIIKVAKTKEDNSGKFVE